MLYLYIQKVCICCIKGTKKVCTCCICINFIILNQQVTKSLRLKTVDKEKPWKSKNRGKVGGIMIFYLLSVEILFFWRYSEKIDPSTNYRFKFVLRRFSGWVVWLYHLSYDRVSIESLGAFNWHSCIIFKINCLKLGICFNIFILP